MCEHVKKKLKLEINETMAKRVKRTIMTEIEGDYKDDYRRLWDYAEELRQTNAGTTVEIIYEEGTSMFSKIYICFHALKQGWISGCRPILGLDGCFIKNKCKGELLTTVGRDGNDQRFPVAWAVVRSETKENWIWFLKHLKADLRLTDRDHLTLMSDMQKVRKVNDIYDHF